MATKVSIVDVRDYENVPAAMINAIKFTDSLNKIQNKFLGNCNWIIAY